MYYNNFYDSGYSIKILLVVDREGTRLDIG